MGGMFGPSGLGVDKGSQLPAMGGAGRREGPALLPFCEARGSRGIAPLLRALCWPEVAAGLKVFPAPRARDPTRTTKSWASVCTGSRRSEHMLLWNSKL